MPNLLSTITAQIADVYPTNEARAIARLILNEEFGISDIDLYMGKDIHLSEDECQKMENILSRLHKNEPIQYILGYTIFQDLHFSVNPNVLIPRPETNELVTLIKEKHPIPPKRILDIGTGSGCIAISLSHHWKTSEVEAWDVSTEALDVAHLNNKQLQTNVHFKQQDVLSYNSSAEKIKTFDLIVSNPPYIKKCEKEEMEKQVLDWEPHLALFVENNDPLIFYRTIAYLGLDILSPEGKLYFEINREHGTELTDMLTTIGYKNINLKKDFFGNNRFISASRN